MFSFSLIIFKKELIVKKEKVICHPLQKLNLLRHLSQIILEEKPAQLF